MGEGGGVRGFPCWGGGGGVTGLVSLTSYYPSPYSPFPSEILFSAEGWSASDFM